MVGIGNHFIFREEIYHRYVKSSCSFLIMHEGWGKRGREGKRMIFSYLYNTVGKAEFLFLPTRAL